MSTSPASSSSTAVPAKGASPRDDRQGDAENAAGSPSDDSAASCYEQPSVGASAATSHGTQPSLRVDIPSSSSGADRLSPSGLVSAASATHPDSPFTYTVSAFPGRAQPALSSPNELVPLSSSCSSTSSVSGLTAAFSHVDVEANLAARSSSPNVAQTAVFQPPPQPGVNAPPKKNAHSKPAPQGHVPRPRNPYILYRMDVVARGLIQGEKKHQNISKVVSEMWNALSTEDKAPYVAAAHLEKMEHKRLYPNYIYQPGTDRPKPTRAPRVHKGSKAAAASKKAAAQKGKGKSKEIDQLRAAEELERDAEDDDYDEDYQPTKKRSTSSSKSRGKSSPRPSLSSRHSSSFSSQGEASRTDENQDALAEYEQHGRKRRSNREPFGCVDGTGSPALSGRSVASEASSDFQGSTSGSSSYDDERLERMRMQQGFHISYPSTDAPRPEHAHGHHQVYIYPGPYEVQALHGGPSPQPPAQYGQPAPHPQIFYAPYAGYAMYPDMQQYPHHGQPGRMAPPDFPSQMHHLQPRHSSGLPAFRLHELQQFLPTAEPSPITPGFPTFTHRRGSSFSALGPRPPRRESAGFGLGFQEDETPRTAAFREAFLPRSPAFPPPVAQPQQDELSAPSSSSSSTTPSTASFPADRPTSDTTAQRRKSRNAGPLTELFTREALRPQTFPRAMSESSMRQSWHMGDQAMFVQPPPVNIPQQPSSDGRPAVDDGPSTQQQQHPETTSHFAQPIQRTADMSAMPTYLAAPGGTGVLGLDLSNRRKGRPEPLAFAPAPAPSARQPFFRSLPASDGSDVTGAVSMYGQRHPQPSMDEVTPTQANFMRETEYLKYMVPFDEGPAWALDLDGVSAAPDPSGAQHHSRDLSLS